MEQQIRTEKMWCVIVEFVAADSVHKFCRVREGTKR